jgi:hypothetical protein
MRRGRGSHLEALGLPVWHARRNGSQTVNAITDDVNQNVDDPHDLYDIILRVANKFMHNCKHFPMEFLRAEDPSFSELARITRRMAQIIQLVGCNEDPMMSQKAHDYCELMTAMAVAIERDDHIELRRLVSELERKPGT